jgi:tripartite-type tricarboxylate transporter receptor subunit TctC
MRLRKPGSGRALAFIRTGFASLAVVVAALLAAPQAAVAYPDKPIRLIIPLPPGGAVDVVARIIQPPFEKSTGRTLIIENRPGASGIIGANAAARSDPDGYTLLMVPTTYTINAATRPNQPLLRSMEPVALLVRNSLLFLVHPSVKATTLKELAAAAKGGAQPLSYSSTGLASQAHLLFEQWSAMAGVKMNHVPYPGGPPAVHATVSGETHMTLISSTLALSQIRSGALRAIATSGTTRDEEFPDVPTAAESGFPQFSSVQWIGMFAPSGTPRPIIEFLNKELTEILKLPEVATALTKLGLTPGGGSPQDFRKLVDQEIKMWAEIAEAAKIKVD